MRTQIQFLGHATFRVITPEGKIILIDPWLRGNPFIPEAFRGQEEADLILITHGHDDHFDAGIRDILAKNQAIVVANPICRWFLLENNVDSSRIEPINMGGTIVLLDVKVTMVNALHSSHINVTEDKMTHPHPAVDFVLHLSDDVRIYFAGDTGVFGDMQLIGEIYKPNVAALPIGDRYTMGPLEASYAIKLLNVLHVIPFHYGTYPHLVGTPQELRALTADIEDLQIHALKAGEMLDCAVLPQRTLPSPEVIAAQLRMPSGDLGKAVAAKMNEGNAPMNRATYKLLEASTGNDWLEIGMGNGFFVGELLAIHPHMHYTGLDSSPLMVEESIRRNVAHIASGRASFRSGHSDHLPFNDVVFDKVVAVNVVYFWENPAADLAEIHRVLRPYGRLALGVRTREAMQTMPFTASGFTLYEPYEVENLLRANGFVVEEQAFHEESQPAPGGAIMRSDFVVIVARKV